MLTEIQSTAAKIMAKNRSDESYFAGGSVLNQTTFRQSDDLDIFTNSDEAIPDIVKIDISSLRAAGFDVSVDLEIYGCTDATVRLNGAATQVQWMSESRMRFFPLQADEAWGLRLHMADLAVNKVTAASTRRKARDILDLALIDANYCPLGPLFLAASEKLGRLSPLAMLDNARQRTVSASNDELETLSGSLEEWSAANIKLRVLQALDRAQSFLCDLPDSMIGGLPVDGEGRPTDQALRCVSVRKFSNGGGLFPDFPDHRPDF